MFFFINSYFIKLYYVFFGRSLMTLHRWPICLYYDVDHDNYGRSLTTPIPKTLPKQPKNNEFRYKMALACNMKGISLTY